MGLATAVNRLKESDAISKVIILLTDGVNNKGVVAPFTAEIAKKFGIRVYTIGVGTEGYAPYPQTPFGIQYQDVEVQIDEETLQNIATVTDGKYFRATNNSKLKEIYKDIDKLEKSKIEVTEFHKRSEEFNKFAIPALLLLVLGFILENLFKTINIMLRYGNVEFLYILAIIPLLIIVCTYFFNKWQKKSISKFGDPDIVSQLMKDYSSSRKY